MSEQRDWQPDNSVSSTEGNLGESLTTIQHTLRTHERTGPSCLGYHRSHERAQKNSITTLVIEASSPITTVFL